MAQLVAAGLRAFCCLSQAFEAAMEAVPLASPGWARLHVRYAGQPVPSGSPSPAQDGGQALPLPHQPAVLLSV